MIAVELHRDARSPRNERGVVDLAPYLSSVSWGDDLDPPWGSAQLTLEPSLRATLQGRALSTPIPGEWIVIRLGPDEPAEWWGRVVSSGAGQSVDPEMGAAVGADGTIRAESWLAALGREQILAQPGLPISAGTILAKADWRAIIAAVRAGFASGAGTGLAAMLSVLGQVMLPGTLGGELLEADTDGRLRTVTGSLVGAFTRQTAGTLGDAITVVHDPASAAVACGVGTGARRRTASGRGSPRRQAEAIPTTTLASIASLMGQAGATVLDYLTGTFSADPMLTEFFPSLEDYAPPAPAVPVVDPRPLQSLTPPLFSESSVPFAQPQLPALPTVATPSSLGSASSTLGRNPVLVYRMRPWRAQDLAAYALSVGYLRELDPKLFRGVTWSLDRATTVDASDVLDVRFEASLEDGITAVTIGLPNDVDSPIRFFSRAGLPVFSPLTVIQYGLKLYSINWPFYRLSDTKANGGAVVSALREARQTPNDAALAALLGDASLVAGSLMGYLRSLAVLGHQFLFNGDKFLAGRADLATLRCDVRHGEIVVLGTASDPVNVYVTAVTHTVTREPDGSEVRTTSFDFARGLRADLEAARVAPSADLQDVDLLSLPVGIDRGVGRLTT